MFSILGACWLGLILFVTYLILVFGLGNLIPFIYAWLDDNDKKEYYNPFITYVMKLQGYHRNVRPSSFTIYAFYKDQNNKFASYDNWEGQVILPGLLVLFGPIIFTLLIMYPVIPLTLGVFTGLAFSSRAVIRLKKKFQLHVTNFKIHVKPEIVNEEKGKNHDESKE